MVWIAYMSYDDNSNTRTSVDDSYVPKSRRSKWMRTMKEAMLSMTGWVFTWVDNLKLSGQYVAKQIARRRRVARAIYNIPRKRCVSNRMVRLLAMAAVVMPAVDGSGMTTKRRNEVVFDTDADVIGVDNRASGCISHSINDFEGPLRESAKAIKGFGGTRTTNVKIGTIVWRWQDNEGKVHKFTIPNSYYVPEGKVRLLSP
jgi:hypothetical protein